MIGFNRKPFYLLPVLAPHFAGGQNRVCQEDFDCEEWFLPGSKCMETGQCSNPYAAGCLAAHSRALNGDKPAEQRICNSNDGTDEHCKYSDTNYTEVRVHNGDWESSIFYSWILQIFLSEFLDIPVTVGLNKDDSIAASFYSIEGDVKYSEKTYAFQDLLTANDNNGVCHLTDEDCIHVMPEVWIGQEKTWEAYSRNGSIDQVNSDGQVGKISWYIPRATAERFPSLVSYHGMVNERELLASIFKRPTSWGEYCRKVSSTNCTVPDEVAQRQPKEEANEDTMYFSDGEFTGYFRAADANNCTGNPNGCTGHIVGAPCSFSTNVDAQTYHNDIPLQSDGPLQENQGYANGQMIQIWRAANATDSDVIMWWWTPNPTTEEFRGGPYEFQPVLLPEPTSTCREARILPEDRCNKNPEVRRGSDPVGGCDNEMNSLQKIIASSLRDLTYATPEIDRSPAYQAILKLKVDHFDMNNMLRKWVDGGRTGYAARRAVCDYVLENQEELLSYIPRGYPRTFEDDTSFDNMLLKAALGFSAFAVMYVIVVGCFVWYFKDSKVMVYAQVSFMLMILFGLFLVATGSIFYTLEPSRFVCTSRVWLIFIGYTMELVPLLVKVMAINRLMAAGKKMKRLKIRIEAMFLTVALVAILVIVFLSIWTGMDAPDRTYGRYLSNGNEIHTIQFCASESRFWYLIMLSWNAMLVVCATVLALQSRKIKQEFHDSQGMGIMIYSHFIFAVLRGIVFNLDMFDLETGNPPALLPSTFSASMSFLLSADIVSAVTIYLVPKLKAARNGQFLRRGRKKEKKTFVAPGISDDETIEPADRKISNTSRREKILIQPATEGKQTSTPIESIRSRKKISIAKRESIREKNSIRKKISLQRASLQRAFESLQNPAFLIEDHSSSSDDDDDYDHNHSDYDDDFDDYDDAASSDRDWTPRALASMSDITDDGSNVYDC